MSTKSKSLKRKINSDVSNEYDGSVSNPLYHSFTEMLDIAVRKHEMAPHVASQLSRRFAEHLQNTCDDIRISPKRTVINCKSSDVKAICGNSMTHIVDCQVSCDAIENIVVPKFNVVIIGR